MKEGIVMFLYRMLKFNDPAAGSKILKIFFTVYDRQRRNFSIFRHTDVFFLHKKSFPW